MKMKPRCIPCLLKRVYFETGLVTRDQNLQNQVLQNAMDALRGDYGSESSARIATRVHRVAYETMGSSDPYLALKEKSNQVACDLLPRARKLIRESHDPLEAAVLCSIIGNSIDFGIEGSASNPQDLEACFENLFSEGFGYTDLARMKSLLKGRILLFTDNCGEIVFDAVLCEELKKFDISLTVVVKGEPILTDATLEDAQGVHLDKIADELLTTGGFAVGVDFSLLPSRVSTQLEEADLIICKGMANYEAFSETAYRPIAYLMRVKCKSIAEDANLPLNSNIVKLYENNWSKKSY